MRSIIVDYVRARGAERRGGDQLRVTLVTDIEKKEFTRANFDELSGELESLERIDPRAYRVVELRFFGGMEIEEIARFLDTSPATVKRDWTKARMFLRHRLDGCRENRDERFARRSAAAGGDDAHRPAAG